MFSLLRVLFFYPLRLPLKGERNSIKHKKKPFFSLPAVGREGLGGRNKLKKTTLKLLNIKPLNH